MNSAVKQHPRSLSRLLGRWATLAALLFAALPSPGQVTLTGGTVTINDATLDNTLPPPQPSIPSAATPYGTGAAKVTLGDTYNGKTVVGRIQKAAIELSGVTHSYIADLDVALVGPGGKKVMLMSDVALGMQASSSAITITGTTTGGTEAAAFPASGLPEAVLSGTFRATDFQPGESLVAPAPGAPYETSLNVFNGDTGKGDWLLYVNDDSRFNAGQIASWAVKLWYAPVISTVTSTNTAEDTPLTFGVTVTDLDNDILSGAVTVSAVTSDTNVVENSGLVVTKPASGNVMSLTITPRADRNGPVTITVRVNDGTTTETFPIALTVDPRNDRPTLGELKFGSTVTNVVRAVQGQLSPAYTVGVADIDSALASLTVAGSSSGDSTNLVLGSDVFFVPGESGATRTFYVAPKGNAVGETSFNLVATDNSPSNSLPKTIPFSVAAAADRKVFANFNPISIASTENATNRATVAVSGIADALIGKVSVVLANVTHPNPEELDVWLVGPSPANTRVALMNQAGGNNPVSNGRLIFDSTASTPVPDSTALIAPNQFQATYAPADYSGATTPNLNVFNGTNPNGTWTVVVVDRAAGNSGVIASGVILSVWTAPVIGAISNVTVDEDAPTQNIGFSVSDLDGQVSSVTAVSSDTTKATVTMTYTAGAANGTVKVTPVSNAFGASTITLTATDNSGYTVTRSFTFTINSVNDLPTISPIAKQLTYVGKPVPDITFDISDVETADASLVVTATSSNRRLLPDANISILTIPSASSRTLRLFPMGLASSTTEESADVTVRVTDGNGGFKESVFRLNVLPKASPIFGNAEPRSIQFRDSGVGGPAAAAFPSPSIINVSGLIGTVTKISVNLLGLEHPNPDDLDILLVGPQGQKVMLMSDAGGTADKVNLQLSFDSTASGQLPFGGGLSSGTYLPSDYDGGDADTFLVSTGTAPVKPSPNNALSIFDGTNPNGEWKLYVMDDTGNSAGDDKVGVIAGGWDLVIQTSPVLASIPNLTTPEDEPVRSTVDLGDDQPGIPTSFNVTSSNPSLILPSKVAFSEPTLVNGDLRTMTITPELNQSGVSTITVQAVVGGVASNTRSFTVTVNAVNDNPTITGLTTLNSVPVGLILGPVAFTVSDAAENTDPALLVVTAVSLDPILPSSNLIVGGSGANRTLTILPVSGRDAISAAIRLEVTDPQGGKGTQALTYSTSTRISSVFTDPTRISIDDNAQARPYPSTIPVSGVSGLVNRVRVTLNGFTHAFPDDVNIVLVKGDKAVALMGNAGGGAPTNSVTDLTVGFAQSAAGPIPDEAKLAHGNYQPARYGGAQTPPNASANGIPATIAESLDAFNGVDPNGDWKLFIWDDTRTDAGEIARGWSIAINTGPRIVTITAGGRSSPLLGSEDVVLPVNIELSDSDTPAANLTLTAEVDGATTVINNAGLKFDPSTTNQFTRILNVLNITNISGNITNTVRLTAGDGTSTAVRTFQVSFSPVDDLPVLTLVTNVVTINEDGAINVDVTISDVDSVLDKTNVVVTSSNTSLLPTPGFTGPTGLAAGSVGTITVTNKPLANQSGESTVTVSIKDNPNRSTPISYTLRVNAVNDAPTISSIPDYTGPTKGLTAGTGTNIVFQVADLETDGKNLRVTAKARKSGVLPETLASSVPDANLTFSESGTNRVLNITTIGTSAELVTITLTVTDGELSTTESFDLEVFAPQPVPGTVYADTTPAAIVSLATTNLAPITVTTAGDSTERSFARLYRVSVAIAGLSHTAPDDLDVLLVAPNNQGAVVLMSDAGGRIPVSNLLLEFSDSGANGSLRDDGPLVPGVFVPSNYSGDGDSWAGYTGPIFRSLSELNGINPNGTWRLLVSDDAAGDVGNISQGWSIKIVTTPVIRLDTVGGGVTQVDHDEDTVGVSRVILSDLDVPGATIDGYEITKTSSNANILRGDKINVPLAFGSVQYAATPEASQYDQSTNLTTEVTFTRKSDRASSKISFKHVIKPVNDAPEITRTTDRSTNEDVPMAPLTVTFTDQTDPGEPASGPVLLDVIATSSDQAIVSDTNILVYGFNSAISNRVAVERGVPFEVVVRPNANAAPLGVPVSVLITLRATDRNTNQVPNLTSTATRGFGTFQLTINPRNDSPSVTKPADQSVETGGSRTVSVTIADPDDSTNLKLTATSSNQDVIKNANIVVTPESGGLGARTVSFRVEPNLSPTSVDITLVVADKNGGAGSSTGTPQTFRVNVVPSREQRYQGGQILIGESGPGTPYPSTIQVDNLNGNITKVRVELRGFAHGYPDDLDVVLVSPTGKKVALMSDAGGSVSVTNLVLVFDQAASSVIPDASALTSGTFQPGNHDVASDPFPSASSGSGFTAPVAPFATSLDEFNGQTAKGTWQLYVVDDTRQDGGKINEWNLYIATGPRISGLADVGSIPEDTTFTVPFEVLDEDFATGAVSFGFATTNSSVVAVSGLSVGPVRGSGYLLTGVPVRDASGSSKVTIYATNSFGQVASGSFNVTLTPVNDSPVITPESGTVLLTSGESGQFGFNYSDAETTQKDLQLVITSSNPELVPTSNIFLFDTNLVIAPVGNLTGRAEIGVTVSDAAGLTAKATYSVIVEKALHAQFANTNVITLPVSGPATTQYPSTINVAGVRGVVSKVTVTLAQIYHPYPADLDVLLVSPGTDAVSKKIVLMSDSGGGRPLTPSRLTFADAAATTVPYNPATAVAPGTYKPSNNEGNTDAFAGAPAGPYTYVLSDLAGIDPNGEWKLYVVDDAAPDSGRIDGGWVLNIFTTQPSIGDIADVATPETVPVTVPFRIADPDTALENLRVVVTTDRPSLLSIGPVTVRTPTSADPFNNRQVVITPVGFNNGDASVTIEVSDATPSTAAASFRVTVTPVNQAPNITGLSDKSTPANRTLTVPFVVGDNETAASEIVVTATLDRPSFGTVEVTTGGANRQLVFRPAGEKGVTAVSVVATDGSLSTTNQILVTVSDPYVLTVTPIADQLVPESGSRTVPFTVLGSETGNVSVTASAGTSGVLSSVRVEGSGTSWVLFLNAVPGANGSTLVTVTANDEFGSGTVAFTATIVPVDDPPVIGVIPDVTTYANINAIVRIPVSDPDTDIGDLEFTWASSNPALVRNVLFAVDGSTVIATVIPNRDQLGQASLTVFANDGTTKVGRPFLLTVSERPNDPPTLAPIPDQETFANVPAFIRLSITDPDTAVADMVISGTAANAELVQSVVAGLGTDGSPVLNIRTKRDAIGQSAIQVSVNDGKTTVSRSFILTVRNAPNEPSVLQPIADQVLEANQHSTITLGVSDPDTAIGDLIVTGTVSNPSVLKPIQVSNDGTTIKVLLTPVTDAVGVAAVTITVDDGANKVSRTFAVTVKAAAAPVAAIPTLTVLPDGSRVITITWENGGELEWAPSASGPWTKTGNSSGSYTETLTGGAKIFRIVRKI